VSEAAELILRLVQGRRPAPLPTRRLPPTLARDKIPCGYGRPAPLRAGDGNRILLLFAPAKDLPCNDGRCLACRNTDGPLLFGL